MNQDFKIIFAGVKLEVLMPKCILNCVLTSNQGKYNFDPVSKILHWDIGKIDVTKLPNIRGSVSMLKQLKINSVKIAKSKCILYRTRNLLSKYYEIFSGANENKEQLIMTIFSTKRI